ncbi:MAG TPA: hypothetical protein VEU51_09565 [Candidatus Acidoferrales bacterium]|nr:hypothetical protein [Candidatus Acidoferrales bacterium]
MFERLTIRRLAAAMAILMTLASLPSIGVIVVADSSVPSIALDVCHPLQSLDQSTTSIVVARPATPALIAREGSSESFFDFVLLPKGKSADAPEAPPPKIPA